jgi:uncharacterized protein with HEPN domain
MKSFRKPNLNMPKRDPTVRLLHVRDFAQKALDLTEGKSREDLEQDEVLLLAVTHLLELVGEAAAHVPRQRCRTTIRAFPGPRSSACGIG